MWQTPPARLGLMKTNSRIWTIAVLSSLGVAVWFLWPQMSVILLTALLAYVFYPLYVKLKRKKDSSIAAASLTLVISFMIVIIPLTIIIGASIAQLAGLADAVTKQGYLSDMPVLLENTVETVNRIAEKLTGSSSIVTGEGIVNFLKSSLSTVARTTVNVTLGVIGGLPQMGIALLIYVFLFIELLMYGPRLVGRVKQISPFDKDTTDRYFERAGLMANAMVKGQLIIAMTLALISVILLVLLGYGKYAFLLFIVFTVLNFIPLGAGVVLVPMALYSMMTGQFWLGLIVIILYAVSGNLDPVMRTKLIPRTIQQSVAVTMIATFCGIAYFGMLGVVYGPIIMLLISTTFEMYAEHKTTKNISAR